MKKAIDAEPSARPREPQPIDGTGPALSRPLGGTRLADDFRALSAQGNPHPRRSGWLRWGLSMAVVLGVAVYLARDKVAVSELLEVIAATEVRWLLVAAVLIVANRIVMAFKWWLILRGEGLRLDFVYLVMVTFVGYFVGRLVPGALGMEVVRIWYLARDHGIGTVGLASVVIDRSTSFAALALVALAALLAFEVAFPGRELMIAISAAVLVGFAILTGFAPLLSSWLEGLGPASGRRTRVGRLLVKGRGMALAVSNMQGRRGVVSQSMLVGVAAQLLRGVGIYFVFVALGQPGMLAASLAVAPILMFVTMVPLGISSIAVSAGAMVLLLEPLGVAAEVSLSASLVSDALLLLLIPIGGLCFAASGFWRRRLASAAR